MPTVEELKKQLAEAEAAEKAAAATPAQRLKNVIQAQDDVIGSKRILGGISDWNQFHLTQLRELAQVVSDLIAALQAEAAAEPAPSSAAPTDARSAIPTPALVP